MDTYLSLIWFSAISFIFFGVNCFISKFIKNEFIRYGLPKFRFLIGFLQVFGALGLLFGHYYNHLVLLLAATGLSILMTAGLVVRIRIKDNIIKSSPALTFAVINFIIAVKTYFKYFNS